MTPAADLRVLVWNVRKGLHLREALDWAAGQRPDIILWQEGQSGDLHTIGSALHMHGYPGADTGTGHTNIIFLFDDGPLQVDNVFDHPGAPHIAPANISVRLRLGGAGTSARTLSLVSHHGCYYSAGIRLREADWLTTLVKEGEGRRRWLTLAAGDFNDFPVGETPADDARVTDPAFRTNRTYMEGGRRHWDDRGDSTLAGAGYTDAARWAAGHLGQSTALDPTTGHGDEERQGGRWRTDRTYVTDELARAITGVTVGSPDEVGHISDHLPYLLTLSTHTLEEIMTAPLPAGVTGDGS